MSARNPGPMSQEDLDDELAALEAELEEAGLVEAPDGGWGWAIVAASFLANVIVDGIIFTSGAAFQPAWEAEFGASSGATAWTVSLLSGGYLLSGPIASALANIYGCRLVTAIGCLVSVTGFVLSMFAPSLWVLYVTFGVVGGVGFGLMYLPSIVIVSFYFKKRRALATGLAVCGSGIGTFAFAPLSKWLMDEYSWRQTMLIVAGISLNGLVAAAAFRPLEPSKKEVERVARVIEKYPELLGEETPSIAGNGVRTVLSTEEVGEDSALVAHGVRFERFGSRAGIRQRAGTAEHPFVSVMELRAARERNASLLSVGGPRDPNLARVISKDSVNLLNRPLSRMDIFYQGSTTALNGTGGRLRLGSTAAEVGGSRLRATSSRNFARSALSVAAPEMAGLEGDGWKDKLRATLGTMLDVSLLKSPTFVLFSFCGFLTLAGFFVPFVYLPRYAEDMGHSKENGTFLISVLGIANIVFRVLCGWVSDQPWLNALQMHNVALLLGGLATVVVPFLDAYWMLVVYCVVFGFATACFASLRSIICAELLGLERLTSSFGLLLLIMGIAALAGSPVAGALADATGSYAASFHVMGVVVALSGLLAFPLRRLSNWEFAEEIAAAEAMMAEMDNGGNVELDSIQVVYCVVFGFATACFASLRSIICAELLGLERLTSSFGLLLLIMGIAALAGSPVAGALADATGSYAVSFHVMGVVVALSGLLAFPLRRLSNWEFAEEIAAAEAMMAEMDNGGNVELDSIQVEEKPKSS